MRDNVIELFPCPWRRFAYIFIIHHCDQSNLLNDKFFYIVNITRSYVCRAQLSQQNIFVLFLSVTKLCLNTMLSFLETWRPEDNNIALVFFVAVGDRMISNVREHKWGEISMGFLLSL